MCPLGWQPAGDICVKLFFNPATSQEAKEECLTNGAQLVNIVRNEQENKALLNDLTDLINVIYVYYKKYESDIYRNH